MAKYTGEDLVVTFKGTDVSGAGRALEVTEEATEIDVTTYGSVDNEYLVTKKKDRTASFTVLDDAGSTTTEELFEVGTSGTLVYSPEGTVAGKRKRTVTALVLRSRKSFPHDDVTQFAVDFRLTGAITKGTN
jgi:hypothetical protein